MKTIAISLFMFIVSSALFAATQISPNDPTQYIRYWADQVIDPVENDDARWAHDIYEQLLRAWDYTRVAPTLNVIQVKSGTWAASLADGNILLTQSTLDLIQQTDAERADHLLAFVIAHELAHQRSDDLWHLKFYRMVGDQSPEAQSKVLGNLITADLAQIEKAEAQADQDAIVLMATVGFDPHAVINGEATGDDFYTVWVEQLWQNGCEQSSNNRLKVACAQAQLRALRTKAQIESIAEQAVLYQLGVQAMVAGEFEQARRYFTVYGRSFPNRAVLTSIGLTYLAEAFELYREVTWANEGVPFYYPLFLDSEPLQQPILASQRGARSEQMIASLAQKSLDYFSQAKKLAPDHPNTYLLMISAYQLMGNAPMAEGLLRGEYISRFGADVASQYLTAMNSAINGKANKALEQWQVLEFTSLNSALPMDALAYAALMNQTALLLQNDDEQTAKTLWAGYAKEHQQSETDLFQIALNQLQPQRAAKQNVIIPTAINKLRIGDKWLKNRPQKTSDIWYDGAPYELYHLDGRAVVLDDEARIISVWATTNTTASLNILEMKWPVARVIAKHGAPTRRMDLVTGRYLAYDHLGFAVKIEQERVAGWFFYLPN